MINDDEYMLLAISEAANAFDEEEVPVGAVIIKDGGVIAKAHNMRKQTSNALAHAEIIAIDEACKYLGRWILDDCTIYITSEPCLMCAGAIIQSRVGKVIYGAPDLKGGAFGSSLNVLDAKNINHRPEIVSGVLEEECAEIIRSYFKNKRKVK